MFDSEKIRIRRADVKLAFINRIYEGDNLCEACAFLKINPAVLGLERRNDPEFDASIRDAQSFRVDMLADKLENIQDYEENPVMAGVISKNIQWLASKRLRQIYGDKLDVNHNVMINITAAMNEARNRVLTFNSDKPLITQDSYTDTASVLEPINAEILEDDPLS